MLILNSIQQPCVPGPELGTGRENRKMMSHYGFESSKGLRQHATQGPQPTVRATNSFRGPQGRGGILHFRKSLSRLPVEGTLELGLDGWIRFCWGSTEGMGKRVLQAEGKTWEENAHMLLSIWSNSLLRERKKLSHLNLYSVLFRRSILISDVKTFSLCTSKYCNWSDSIDM